MLISTNTVGKGQNDGEKYFVLFLQYFLQVCSEGSLKNCGSCGTWLYSFDKEQFGKNTI